MTSVYNDADLLSVYKQKQRIFWVFMGVTLAYAAFCIAWLIYYISLPYNDPMQTLPKMCVYVVSALYVVFTFPYMAIKFSRVRRYYKALVGFSDGMKNEEKNYFYCFEEMRLQKENIDVTSCIFETWSKKKNEWLEREAYFDPEKPLPDFGSGDYVQYISQSNFIVQYRILERGVYQFEEVDEEYEEYEAEERENTEYETEAEAEAVSEAKSEEA